MSAGSLADVPVIDTDFHITDAVGQYVSYLEEPWDALVSGKLGEDMHTDVVPYPGFLHPAKALGRIDNPEVTTVEDVREGMAALSVDVPILTPGGQSLYFGMVHHDEMATALARGYNDWLLDAFLDEDDDLVGAISIPPHQPSKIAEEIDDKAGESGIVGAALPAAGVNPPLGDERYYPIYEACADAGLPVMLHGAAAGAMLNFPFQYQGLRRGLPVHVISHPMLAMTNAASLLTRGVPERFPDLDIVLQESGIGWIPYFMRRFDWEYAAMREDAPLLRKPPSEYLVDRFYYTSQPIEGIGDPEYVSRTIRLFEGQRTLMFSSDYPHQDFDNTEHLYNVLRGRFDEDEVRNVLGGTAMDVFGISA